VRVVKGPIADPNGRKRFAYLVRPPLYFSEKELALLEAKAISLNLLPPEGLTRQQRASARESVIAELCRRTVLAIHAGQVKFPPPPKGTQNYNRALRAFSLKNVVVKRFPCWGCDMRKRDRARRRNRSGRKLMAAKATLREARKRERALLRAVARAEEELRQVRFELRLAKGRLEEKKVPAGRGRKAA